MENLRNRCTVDLLTSEERLKNLAAQPSFKQLKIFHENLVAVERAKVELTLNWLIYVVFDILDLLKTLMYDFHYNHIKWKYPDSPLLFTNTDFLTYQIQTDSVSEDLYADKQLFSFSGYERVGPFNNDENKKSNQQNERRVKRGKYWRVCKFEGGNVFIKKKKEEMKKAKGAKKKVVKKDSSYQDYVDCLFEERKFMHSVQTIRSFKHQLYTIKQNKVS